jgi:YYY domain-containing protein
MRDILTWVAVVELMGLATLPYLSAYFGNRRDAALLSRVVGLALTGYVGWALTLLLTGQFGRGTLFAAFAALGIGGLLLNRRRRAAGAAREPFYGPEGGLAAAIFWGSAGFFLVLRAAAPEVVGTEKFMDLAFLTSLTKHPAMPPLDPWMSGFRIPYYYWGYLLAAVPAKLAGVDPSVAYNLALPTFAGLSACAAACIGFRLSKGRLEAGLAAAFAVVFAGNLVGGLDALRHPFAKDFDYWQASRVIGVDPQTHDYTTISEFPFFTFFHADLHPHLLAFPFFVAAFALAHRFIERGRHLAPKDPWTVRSLTPPAAMSLLFALVAGTSVAANKWTLPAMAILLVVAGVFRTTAGRKLPELDEAVLGAAFGAALFGAARILFRPYELSYELQDHGLGRTTVTSGLLEFLGVWGTLLLVGYLALRPKTPDDSKAREKFLLAGAGSVAGALALGLALTPPVPTLVLLVPLALLAARRGWKALHEPGADGRDFYTAFLLLFGLAMIGGCEFIYFKDNYGVKLQRMNTIFKFYHQAWPLLAIAAVVFTEQAWRAWGGRSRSFRLAIAACLIVSAAYPIECFVWKLRNAEGPVSFDARAALRQRNPADAAAIAWLEQNAPPGSVVLEATGDPYSEFSRISTHTGTPTVMGWANHEGLWRGNNPEVEMRRQAVDYFYRKPDTPAAEQVLRRFHVGFVVVGDMERKAYPGAERVAESPSLILAFQGPTSVYRVAP